MVDETQRQRAFTRPETGRTFADTIGRTVGRPPMPGETGRSLGPAGGPTTFENTSPRQYKSPSPRFSPERRGNPRQLPVTPLRQYEHPLPFPPERGYPMPMPMPFPPERGYPMPMPMPMPFPRPGGFQDEREFQGFDTSETARENFISRTDGGYPDRPKSVDERFRDYLMRGLDYMPSPIGAGSRILKGLPSLYGENATEYIEELPVTPLQGDNFDDQTSGIMGAMPQERQTAGLIQTWQKIKDNISEAAANEWLASQQA